MEVEMKRVWIAAIALAFLYASPQAQEKSLEGVYRVNGRNPDGGAYLGVLEVVEFGSIYAARFIDPGGAEYEGYFVVDGDVADYVTAGGTFALYRWKDGAWHGTWAGWRKSFTSTETLAPSKQSVEQLQLEIVAARSVASNTRLHS